MEDIAAPLRAGLEPPLPDPDLPEGVPAAVVVPILDLEEPWLLFTKRTEDVGSHKGEISFPGGARHDEDPDLLTTALRETEEELGIPAAFPEVLGRLRVVEANVSGFVVAPYVARLAELPPLRPSPIEVAEVLRFPLRALADVEALEHGEWEGVAYQTHTYRLDGHVVWGLTGRILHQLLRTLEREGWR